MRAFTSGAIALASPSGRMSAAARRRAQERIRRELFPGGLEAPRAAQPSEREALLRRAAELRALAARGMKPRAYARHAEQLEARAAGLTNPAALEAFDLSSRAEWERAIRAAGGLKIARQDAPDYADLPGYLKGYRARGIAPDELAQQISDATGVPAGQVERAMIRVFHAPRRRGRPALEGGEAWEPERRPRGGLESRPRLTVMGDTFGIRPRSPFKGRIHYAANRRRTMSRRRRNQPAEYWDLVRQADALYSEIYRIRQRHFQPMGMGYGRQLPLGETAQARVAQLTRERSRLLSRARALKKKPPATNRGRTMKKKRSGTARAPGAGVLGNPRAGERQIAFTTDRHGRPIAYRWSIAAGGRWFRVPYDDAKIAVATGQAREVRYVAPARTAYWHGGEAGRNPRGPRSRYCRETIQPKSRYERRSFRTVVSRGHRVVIGCPKGAYARGRCRTATEAQAILHPEGEGRCPFGSPAHVRRNPPIARSQRLHNVVVYDADRREHHREGRYYDLRDAQAHAMRLREKIERLGWNMTVSVEVERGRSRRNPPGRRARLSTFYDRIEEIRGVKGRRSRSARPGRYKHRFTAAARARGVDRAGWYRLRRGQVVLGGRRPVYARFQT